MILLCFAFFYICNILSQVQKGLEETKGISSYLTRVGVSGCLPVLLAELPESLSISEPRFLHLDQERKIVTFYLPHKNISKVNLHIALFSPEIKEFKAP